MDKGVETITLGQVWTSLTVVQLWTLIGTIIGAFAAAFLFGGYVQTARDATASIESRRISDGLKASLHAFAKEKQALKTKADFLSRYITYLEVRDEQSKKVFADYVCAMWISQENHVSVDFAPFERTLAELATGVDASTRKLLLDNGVSADDIASVEEHARESTSQAMLQKSSVLEPGTSVSMPQLKLVKEITFLDNSRYRIPQEISTAVHLHPECKPITNP